MKMLKTTLAALLFCGQAWALPPQVQTPTPTATSTTPGISRPDNNTITVDNGVLSASPGGLAVPNAPVLSGNGSALGAATGVFGFPANTANLGSGGATTLTDGTGSAIFKFTGPNWSALDDILTITSPLANSNSLALQSTSPAGYSALVLRDQFNNEVSAFYHPNSVEATGTGNISGTTLTMSLITGGSVKVGQTVVGASSGTYITAYLGGTGSTGTYTVNNSQTLASGPITLLSGGANFESSCLANLANPCAKPPPTNFRQTWQPGGTLTTRTFMNIDYNSTLSFQQSSTCNGVGNEFGMQATLAGTVAFCLNNTDTGAAFEVGSGPSCFEFAIGTMGTDCSGGGAVSLFGTTNTTKLLRLEHIGVGKSDILYQGASNSDTTRGWGAYDTDNSLKLVAWFDMAGKRGVSFNGQGSDQGRVGTVRQAPSNFAVNGDAQAVTSVLHRSALRRCGSPWTVPPLARRTASMSRPIAPMAGSKSASSPPTPRRGATPIPQRWPAAF